MRKYKVWFWFDGERENAQYRIAKSTRQLFDVFQDLDIEYGVGNYEAEIEEL